MTRSSASTPGSKVQRQREGKQKHANQQGKGEDASLLRRGTDKEMGGEVRKSHRLMPRKGLAAGIGAETPGAMTR